MAIDSVLLVVDFIHHRTFQSGVFVLMDFFIVFVSLELMMDVNPKMFH